ncbi:MAG: MFS transporter [Propionibacteriales bacterium]|nr:MFS transporter [Propionibacteriales bacterium]
MLLGVVSMLTDISSEAVSAVLPIYLTSVVGLAPLAYGLVDGIFHGASALVRVLGGWIADRGDHPKWVAVFGYGVSALTRLAIIPMQGLVSITMVISVDRLGKGVRTAPRDALIAASSPRESLGRAFGVHRALDTTGALIGPLLAFLILLAVPGGYRAVFLVSFAAAAVGLAVLLLFVPDLRPRRAMARGPAEMTSPSLRLLGERRFGGLVAATALVGVVTVGDGFLYLSLLEQESIRAVHFPLLFVGSSIAYLALAVPLGRLSDRIGRARVFVAGHLALLGAYLCAGGLVEGAAIGISCLLLLGTYYAATDGVLAALTGNVVHPSVRASGIATAQTMIATARFMASLGFGTLWTLIGLSSAMMAVAVGLVVVLPIAWLLLRHAETDLTSPAPV